MAAAAIDPADLLSRLLRAEQADTFAYLAGDADPYIGQSCANLRQLLPAMVCSERRREGELACLVEDLGGTIRPAVASAEVQYLAYLSADYLLPKLVEARQRAIARYEQALADLPDAPAEVVSLLKAHLNELRRELEQLESGR